MRQEQKVAANGIMRDFIVICKHAQYDIATCGLSGSTTLPHIWHNVLKVIEHINVCFDFLYNFCLKNLSLSELSEI